MKKQTAIEWADYTVNWWWGCTKVGPGCDHCYAESWAKRTGADIWGPHAARRKITSAPATLAGLQRGAKMFKADYGHAPRVFFHSMSDVFDNAVVDMWRAELFAGIEAAPDIRPIILTKRIQNVEKLLWLINAKWPAHAGLMITVVNQAEANRDVPLLLKLKAALGIPWVGLSVEPMLGPVDLTAIPHHRIASNVVIGQNALTGLNGLGETGPALDWVICGGESGGQARPMQQAWARALRDQCVAYDTAFLFKQWGEWAPLDFGGVVRRGQEIRTDIGMIRAGKNATGRTLDGVTYTQFPEALK